MTRIIIGRNPQVPNFLPTRNEILNGAGGSAAGSTARMLLKAEGSKTGEKELLVPYSPREVSHSNLAMPWEEQPRDGERPPLLLRNSGSLPKMSFTLFLGSSDWNDKITGQLKFLINAASWKQRLYVRYSTIETGLWRITQLSYDVTMRNEQTNEPTRANVQIELTRAADQALHLGPVSGGVKPSFQMTGFGSLALQAWYANGGSSFYSPISGGSGRPRIYTVKKGDTLTSIAIKFYNDSRMWKKIAEVNKITRPKTQLKVGMKLRLP